MRLAVPSDAAVVASILLEAFREFLPLYTPEGFSATTPTEEQIRQRMSEGPMWVALQEGVIVGTVAAVVKLDGLYLRGMAVCSSARGQYIGKKLLDTVRGYAREKGCQRIYLSTTPFLAAAIRLYEQYGFRRIEEGPYELHGTPLFTMEYTLLKQ